MMLKMKMILISYFCWIEMRRNDEIAMMTAMMIMWSSFSSCEVAFAVCSSLHLLCYLVPSAFASYCCLAAHHHHLYPLHPTTLYQIDCSYCCYE